MTNCNSKLRFITILLLVCSVLESGYCQDEETTEAAVEAVETTIETTTKMKGPDWTEYLALTKGKYAPLADIRKAFENYQIKLTGNYEMNRIQLSDDKGIAAYELKRKTDSQEEGLVVFVEAGIHGSEKITTTTALKLLYNLQTLKYEKNDSMFKYDWTILPVLNTDGYDFCTKAKKPEDKAFKKNRAVYKSKDGKECYGVDLNLNFNYKFNQAGSDNPCADNYKGPKPFSEVESERLKHIVDATSKLIHVYISLHSNETRRILLPYSDSSTPSDYKDMMKIAKEISDEMKQEEIVYDIGNIGTIKGCSGGHSVDYFKHTTKIKYTFMIEMPDNVGTDLSTSTIEQFSEEAIYIISKIVEKVEPPEKTSSATRSKMLLVIFYIVLLIYFSHEI